MSSTTNTHQDHSHKNGHRPNKNNTKGGGRGDHGQYYPAGSGNRKSKANHLNNNIHSNSSSRISNDPTTPQQNNIPTRKKEEEDGMDDPLEHHHCLICYSPNLHLQRGITPCNHDSICASCHLRLRSLLDDKKCPICKAQNEQIIIDVDLDPKVDQHKLFEQYETWGEDLGPTFTFREDVGMFFPISYYQTHVIPLFSLGCNVGHCKFTNGEDLHDYENNSYSTATATTAAATATTTPGSLKDLKEHLATKHHPPLQLCDLCVEHKRDFVSRLPRYTAHQLKEHYKYGDVGARHTKTQSNPNNTNMKGHPMCNFCAPLRFYDLTELHKHLHRDHYECFVCKKLDKPLQFFRDYNKLNLHFDREHYLCKFPECLAARFIVFANDIDLKAHERDVHGQGYSSGHGRSTKIQMEFRVRGTGRDGSGIATPQQAPNMEEDFAYGLDGEVFVPPSLEESNGNTRQEYEPEITHGPHADRTQFLREEARRRREELGITSGGNNPSAEAFPTLSNSSTASGEHFMGWAREGGAAAAIRGRNHTELNEENFPSLGGPSQTRESAATSKLRATRPLATSGALHGAALSRPFANAAASTRSSNFVSNSNSISSTPYAAINSRANLSADNFPSLSGASSSSANKYAAAQSYRNTASQSNGMNLNLDQHFPVASLSSQAKTAKKSVFDKKVPAVAGFDNVLQFPSISSSNRATNDGAAQIDGMKLVLGQAKYKDLKKLTKRFAAGDIDPESYISSTANLFEQGVKDPSFWDFIPDLVSSVPNKSYVKRAQHYMENLRYSHNSASTNLRNNKYSDAESYSKKKSASSNTGSAWASTTTPANFSRNYANVNNATVHTAAHSVLTGASLQQAIANDSWSSGINNLNAPNASHPSGTAITSMAKEKAEARKSKEAKSIANQGEGKEKKKKGKTSKKELQNLAFGRV
jgi:hypothetical protein